MVDYKTAFEQSFGLAEMAEEVACKDGWQMTQFAWQYLVDKFRANGNRLYTFDMISDLYLAAEYRRILCDLAKKGFVIERRKVNRQSWEYRLVESQADLFKEEV